MEPTPNNIHIDVRSVRSGFKILSLAGCFWLFLFPMIFVVIFGIGFPIVFLQHPKTVLDIEVIEDGDEYTTWVLRDSSWYMEESRWGFDSRSCIGDCVLEVYQVGERN